MYWPLFNNYFQLFLTVPKEQLGKAAQSTSPPPRQLPQTHSPLPFLLLVLRPILIAFLSKVSAQKARFQVHANKPEDKSTWPALLPGRLYTSTLNLWRTNTRPPNPALEFHSAGLPCPEPPSNGQVYVNNGPELKLQRQNMCKQQQSSGQKPLYNYVFHPQKLNIVPEFNEIFK